MAANDFSDIYTALLFSYDFFGGPPGISEANTQFENTEYTPTEGTAWARVTVVPADVRIATLGGLSTGGEDEHTGVLLIDLFYPPNKGWADAMADADWLRLKYAATIYGDSGDATVYTTAARRSGGRVEDGWYRVTVEVEWYARTPR